jgi:hypothetical protein
MAQRNSLQDVSKRVPFVSVFFIALLDSALAFVPDVDDAGQVSRVVAVDAKASFAQVESHQHLKDPGPAEEGISLHEREDVYQTPENDGEIDPEEIQEEEIPPEHTTNGTDWLHTAPVSIGPGYARRRLNSYFLGNTGRFMPTRVPLSMMLVAGPGGLDSYYAICQYGCAAGRQTCNCLQQMPGCNAVMTYCDVQWVVVPPPGPSANTPDFLQWVPMETYGGASEFVIMSKTGAPQVLGFDLDMSTGRVVAYARAKSAYLWKTSWLFGLQIAPVAIKQVR